MASVTEKHYSMEILNILPLESAKSFFVPSIHKRERVDVYCLSESRSTLFKIWMGSASKTKQLIKELFDNTKGQIVLDVVKISLSRRSVCLKFFADGARQFQEYVVPHFFPASEFQVLESDNKVTISDLRDSEIDRTTPVLEKVNERVANNVILKRLKKYGHPQHEGEVKIELSYLHDIEPNSYNVYDDKIVAEPKTKDPVFDIYFQVDSAQWTSGLTYAGVRDEEAEKILMQNLRSPAGSLSLLTRFPD